MSGLKLGSMGYLVCWIADGRPDAGPHPVTNGLMIHLIEPVRDDAMP
ncbi:MAG: hypothetical protein ABIQ24_02875 [Nitrospiraceae bacterium]